MTNKTLAVAILSIAPAAFGQSLAGLWDAKINFNGVEIPFRFEISEKGPVIQGSFFNGDERETSTSGQFDNGSLLLNFDDYATKLTATLKDGALEGQWGPFQKKFYPIEAHRHVAVTASNVKAPS